MAKFKFKLQAVLTYRARKEDALKKELAELKIRHEQERQVLEALAQKLTRTQEELKVKQLEELDTGCITLYHSYLAKVQEHLDLQALKVRELLALVCAMREKLIEASKEKRMMEKLYDKSHEEWQQQILKNEQNLIDEVATSRNKQQRDASLLGS